MWYDVGHCILRAYNILHVGCYAIFLRISAFLFWLCLREYFREGCLQVDQGVPVELDFCALARAVNSPQAYTRVLAIDDGLRELYAALAVLRGDGECEVDDV